MEVGLLIGAIEVDDESEERVGVHGGVVVSKASRRLDRATAKQFDHHLGRIRFGVGERIVLASDVRTSSFAHLATFG